MEDSLHAAASTASRAAIDGSAAAPSLAGFFDDLVRCETRIYNALNDELRKAHDIATSQFEFLRYLRDHPGCRVADLSAYFAVGVGAISKGADRLEARGWVRRAQNPGDRRSSLLQLTGDGAELIAAAELTFLRTVTGLVTATLDAGQLEATAAALAQLRKGLERDRAGMPAG